MPKALLTVPEVADRLRIAEPTVRAMLRRGTLKGFQDGRLIRVTVESVDALTVSQKIERVPA